ncbi:MAG: hypothetical protein KA243_06475 [Candidatus Aminicenantes bacterium]|nr:hypothetical protein [Candidatus Aminicenantes bacterium]
MHTRSKNIAIALAALFVAWLAATPATAAASGVPGSETGKAKAAVKPLDFLSVQDDEEDADTPAAFSRLSLRLYGGYSHMLANDVNKGSSYYFQLVEAYAAEGYGTATGGYSPLHGGYDFGADLVYQITPSFGIGVGAGYIRSSADSLATFTGEGTVDLLASTMLSAVPIRLGLFLDVPLGGKLALTANAGAAYYLGLKFTGMQGLEFAADDWMRMSLEATERSGLDIGFHGSLGFEYKFTPKLGFFVEGLGRYAKLKNFESVTGTQESSGGLSEDTEGKLYLVTGSIGDSEISMFTISETEPLPDPGTTVREPKFDLSGFSLQAGFRIRF